MTDEGAWKARAAYVMKWNVLQENEKENLGIEVKVWARGVAEKDETQVYWMWFRNVTVLVRRRIQLTRK